MKVTLPCKNRLSKWSNMRMGEILILCPFLYLKQRNLKKKNSAYFYTKLGVMYTLSFVKFPDAELEIIERLLELTWKSSVPFLRKLLTNTCNALKL